MWQGATLLLYLLAIRAIVDPAADRCRAGTRSVRAMRCGCCSPLAFPAVFVNLGHGHNGFLTAALIGVALVLLDRGRSSPACCSACSPTSRNSG